jgi:hypothetical protein
MSNLHDRVWDQVSDAEVLLQEQADFRRTDVVLDDLADDPDVVFILPQRGKGLVNVGPRALNDEGAIRSKDRTQVLGGPKSRLACFGLVCAAWCTGSAHIPMDMTKSAPAKG